MCTAWYCTVKARKEKKSFFIKISPLELKKLNSRNRCYDNYYPCEKTAGRLKVTESKRAEVS